ncbi:nitrilase-related carbon-nitrogen hydrolase [Amycolatopsis jiangsuensis]|uniref:Apolipoprotein N-acyltransferase n=1 Tax=Amycolatopsis jiangsuensis TaxID=1181879 RepID=A0A840IVS4_9PSEU|nr:nitrilase-related carbon-nitrogen hydrolase [Amycolatopsis jiangsuensis]MBB4685437.1 apolipoprotein N-acyltransferase [Amycolatopsis jiangsuensis]
MVSTREERIEPQQAAHGRPRHLGLAAGAALCSAVLFYFGTGLAPIAILTWLAPLPVLLLATRAGGLLSAGTAFAAFLLGTANMWWYQAHSGDEPLWPFGVLIDVSTALVFTFAVWVFWALVRRHRVLLASLAAPAAWTAVVHLIAVANPMGMMGTLANDQGDVPLVLQAASWAGMWGVEFLVLLPASAVAALCAPGVARSARVRTGATAVVLLVVFLGSSALRLTGAEGRPHGMAAITQNAGYHWGPELGSPEGSALVQSYVRQIAALPPSVHLVVLPEAAFSAEEEWPAVLLGPMRRAAKAQNTTIVLGFEYYDRPGHHNYDYALAFPPDGGAPARYLKHHDLVSPRGHDLVFAPGAQVPTAMVICGDTNFPRPARDYTAAGARALAVPAELAASPDEGGGWQHSRNALLRGVENGQSLAWSDANGNVVLADGYGRVVAEARTGGPAAFTTVTADVPAGPGDTAYTRFGDWFAWLCLLIVLIGLVATHPRIDRRVSGASAGAADTGDRRTTNGS